MTTQSTILRTAETNNITINGVNVIVDKPKVGDVMCVTKYKNGSGTLLGADQQKVIWIDGLSINPDQLSEELEPVGICMVVNGNKALVKYKEEQVLEWSARPQTLMELPYSSYMNDGNEHIVNIRINNSTHSCYFAPNNTSSRYNFVKRLNEFFSTYYNNEYSAELVELDSEISVLPEDSDKTQGGSYTNRVIITSSYTTSYFDIEGISKANNVEIKGVKANRYIYKKNGFEDVDREVGCCFAKYYYSCYNIGQKSSPVSIDSGPLAYTYFTDYKDSYSFLQTFNNYEDYIDSFMIKYPCGAGGIVADDPSGKESTYKLGNSTYHNGSYALYPAAYYATNISVNAPNLGKGNWWIPSVSEMAQMMRDITYGTSAWATKPDIVNTVLSKLNSSSKFSSYFKNIDPILNKFTSSFSDNTADGGSYIYYYGTTVYSYGVISNMFTKSTNKNIEATPITIYEF